MENKINIAELLKDCPQGMELDCIVYNNCVLEGIVEDGCCYPVQIKTPEGLMLLTQYGSISPSTHSKCVIFPKGKTTWDDFVPPCPFKEGDILHIDCTDESDTEQFKFIFILDEIYNDKVYSYCHYDIHYGFKHEAAYLTDNKYPIRFATEEEKQKLFDAIKTNGYKWNAEAKRLERLCEPRFKVGNRVKSIFNTTQYDIKALTDNHYTIVEVANKFQYMEPIIEDKNWELVLNKFDITTLKPFDKVLVRGNVGQKWTHDFFGYIDKDKGCPFACVGHYVNQCIPYEENKYLLGTTNDCKDYYKTCE